MIPLGTDRPLTRPTVVTKGLILANVAVFVVMTIIARSDPARAETIQRSLWIWGRDLHWWGLVTSAFLHAGLIHLGGNMLFLWVFGPNVEDRLGRVGFLAFYLGGAVASGGLHAWLDPSPAIGASGAIAAVTGAYLVLFPRTHIKLLVFFIIIGIFMIPSWWFIAFSVAWDLLGQGVGGSGVAHLAHLGGYAYGIVVALVLLWARVLGREPYDLFTIWKQARRRAELREVAYQADRQRTRRQQQAVREANDPRAIERARAQLDARQRVVAALDRGDRDGAIESYRTLLDEFGIAGGSLPRDRLVELANALYESGDMPTASRAFETLVGAYPDDPEIDGFRLLLGLIAARHLNDPVRAKQLITRARRGRLDEAHKALADGLLADLG